MPTSDGEELCDLAHQIAVGVCETLTEQGIRFVLILEKGGETASTGNTERPERLAMFFVNTLLDPNMVHTAEFRQTVKAGG